LNELPADSRQARHKAAIAIAVTATIVSVFDLRGSYIYAGLGLTLAAALFGLMRREKKYRQHDDAALTRV
jgi:predicted 2-oxoglutarate/Fe(II)-dependent dioxygenase YbiX